MSGDKIRVYWDACIFLAWLKNESRNDPADMLGVEDQVNQFDAGQIIVVTSVLTKPEVLACSITPEAVKRFELLQQQRVENFYMAEVNFRIADLAHDIRNYYKNIAPIYGPVLTTPDAIHLATAIKLNCNAFYTFDGDGNHMKKKRALPLLQLSGQIAGQYELTIAKPPPPNQQSFVLDELLESGITTPITTKTSD